MPNDPNTFRDHPAGRLVYLAVIRHPGDGYVYSDRASADKFVVEIAQPHLGYPLRLHADIDRGGWVDRAEGDREFAEAEATALRILDAVAAFNAQEG